MTCLLPCPLPRPNIVESLIMAWHANLRNCCTAANARNLHATVSLRFEVCVTRTDVLNCCTAPCLTHDKEPARPARADLDQAWRGCGRRTRRATRVPGSCRPNHCLPGPLTYNDVLEDVLKLAHPRRTRPTPAPAFSSLARVWMQGLSHPPRKECIIT
jgi:hypothetical protein